MSKITCHRCGSTNLIKTEITRGNIQRYLCKNCNRSCQEHYERNFTPIPSNIVCPRCNSRNLIKSSKRERKGGAVQKYLCKDCQRGFNETYVTRNEIKAFSFDDDVWDLRATGYLKDDIDKIHRIYLRFTSIKQPWLNLTGKKYIKFRLDNGKTLGGIGIPLNVFFKLSKYLSHQHLEEENCLTRATILDFISKEGKGKANSTIVRYLSVLKNFFEIASQLNWLNLPLNLIRSEDYPKIKTATSNDIPNSVLNSINNHLHCLPDSLARMWMIAYFCGMRMSELILCPLDCIKQDNKGQWSITFTRKKVQDEHRLPISRELALVIQEQQEETRQKFVDHRQYLFCNNRGGPIYHDTLAKEINKLIKTQNIRDENGKLWHFTSHQLRDTRATNLFETGHEMAVVSQWLGHRHLRTTQKYVHISDDTLRRETAKVQAQLINIKGEPVALEDLPQTLKNNPNSHTLAIPEDQINTPIYGYCGLPLNEDCLHWKACYTCPSFVARQELLPDYIKIRNKLRDKQFRSSEKVETVKVDQFHQQAESLEVIIASFGVE